MEGFLKFCGDLLLLLALLLSPDQPKTTATAVPAAMGMEVHYIDVGQADCALISSDGEYMLIDGGNVDDSRLIVAYLDQQGVEELTAVVCTHAHEDHVGGLSAVLAKCRVEKVYAPVKSYDSKVYSDFAKYARKEGCGITIPKPGDTFLVGSARVQVLGPVKEYEDANNTSLILKVEYGESSFLFTGDMEVLAENDMLDAGANVKADVLKVGHHGSETSTGYRFLYEVQPDYGVISVGKGNTYGHPDTAPLARLRDAGVVLFRTDELGTVIARTNGSMISFTWENQSAQPEDVEPGDTVAIRYVGNKKTAKFHLPDCSSLPKGPNRVEFETYDEAVAAGFSPCRSCFG